MTRPPSHLIGVEPSSRGSPGQPHRGRVAATTIVDRGTGSVAIGVEDHPIGGRLVITAVAGPPRSVGSMVPVWELYEGGHVPALRHRLGAYPAHRTRIRVLTLTHGLLRADEPALTNPQPVLTPRRLGDLRRLVSVQLAVAVLGSGGGLPGEVLLIGDAARFRLIGDLFRVPGYRPGLHWVGNQRPWSQVARVLDRWGWP